METALSKIPPEVEGIVEEAKALTITTPTAYSAAGSLLIRIRHAVKSIEASLADKLTPYRERIKELRAEAEVPLVLLENADKTLNASLLAYDKREREAAAAKNQKSMEKWEKKCEQTAEAGDPLPPPPPAMHAPPIPKVKTADGALSYMTITTWDIPDVIAQGKPIGSPDLSRMNPVLKGIPDEYWTLDTSKITRVVKAGGKIPGVLIQQTKTTMVR